MKTCVNDAAATYSIQDPDGSSERTHVTMKPVSFPTFLLAGFISHELYMPAKEVKVAWGRGGMKP